MNSNVVFLLDYVKRKYPQYLRGIEESVSYDCASFDDIAGRFLEWLMISRREGAIEKSVDAFIQFTTEVNFAQARYEATGSYESKSFAEVYESHYSKKPKMDDYLWGVYLTNFLWAHHHEICMFFRARFVERLPERATIVEIAPGHGGWGVWALSQLPEAKLKGYDISLSSIEMASSLARSAELNGRATYEQCNALDLASVSKVPVDAVICSFLIEHLEEPLKLYEVICQILKPGGVAFVTGALTAAQVDHIFEIRHESEMLTMAEENGLRVLEVLSTNPKRLLPKAKFVPRSMALIIQKPS